VSHDGGVGGVGRFGPLGPPPTPARTTRPEGAPGEFGRVFADKLGTEQGASVKWSAHARQRIEQRQIPVTAEVQARLEGAVDKAAAKGARESLVLMDELAMVVSVTNRTVITAVDRGGMRDQVFTNIDSAVVS